MKFWNQYKGKLAVVAIFTTILYYKLNKANWQYGEDMFHESQHYIKKCKESALTDQDPK